MPSSDPNQAAIEALRRAVQLAPENAELAEHLGRTLMGLLRYDEASEVYREALARHPGHVDLQLGLAETYAAAGRESHALAIVETMIEGRHPEPRALLLHARLMQRHGHTTTAVDSYRQAIEADPELADPALESLLGFARVDEQGLRSRVPVGWEEALEEEPEIVSERPDIDFSSVGGMEAVKEEVRVKIIYPLEHREMYAAYGKKTGGGILLYGPPGCGKTHLARATAGEVKAQFLSVGISDVLDMWVGSSERNLHAVFEQARQSRPCVLFFDEVDALGASRIDLRRSGGRQMINQFLSELDGVDSDNDGLLCLAATNAPWHLDPAFRRPGRFDQVIFVPPPDATARKGILEILLAGKPTDRVDAAKIAAKTADFSGADLTAVVDRAIEGKLREAIRTGRPSPLSTRDLLATAKGIRPSTREWFATARNHALYANESGLYDEILDYLKIKR